MKLAAIVLARVDSRRLPGKAMLPFDGGSLVEQSFLIGKKLDGVDQIVLATSTREIDDSLVKIAVKNSIHVYRGSSNNVSERFLRALESCNCDAAVRLNADSPANNVDLLNEGIKTFKTGNYDLLSNIIGRTFPFGVSVEVVSRNAMEIVCRDPATTSSQKEHVTKYLYDNRDRFRIKKIIASKKAYSGIRLVVDTPEDYQKMMSIQTACNKRLFNMSLDEIIQIEKQILESQFRDYE